MKLIDLDQHITVPITDDHGTYTVEITVGEFFKRFLPGEQLKVVDAVPVVQGWISVKDRLPKKQGFYLAFVPEMARVTLYYNGYEWIVDDDFYAFGAYEITHWMPLPEPPKEDT